MNLKPIKDYEDLYSLDLNTNQVWGHKYKKYKKPTLNTGYYKIRLCKNSKYKYFYFHRLVYEAYNGEIPEGLCIDHIDNNKQNNHIDNLRLATRSENMWNQKIHKNNNKSSGYKNIYLTKWNTYEVIIRKNSKVVYDKTFKNLEEAITNRDIQLKEFHNNFMNLG